MGSISRSIEVRAAPQTVLDILLDVEAYPDWQREVDRVVIDETDDQGRPAQTTVTIRAVQHSGSYTVRYAYPSPDVVEYHLVVGDMMTKHDARFVVRERGAGVTEFTVTLDLALKWRLPGLVIDRLTAQGVRSMLRSVKNRAEAGPAGR